MKMRASTALALVLATGIVAACDDDDDAAELDTTTGEVVSTADADVEEIVVPVETPEAEVTAEPMAEVETAEAEAMEAEIEAAAETAEAGMETMAEEAGEAMADAGAAIEGAAEDSAAALADASEDLSAQVDQIAAEVEADMAEETAVETASAEATASETGDEGLIELDTNVTVVDNIPETEGAEGEQIAAAGTTEGFEDAELELLDLSEITVDETNIDSFGAMIEESETLSEEQKITLAAGLDAARDDPAMLRDLLDQLEAMLAAN